MIVSAVYEISSSMIHLLYNEEVELYAGCVLCSRVQDQGMLLSRRDMVHIKKFRKINLDLGVSTVHFH